MKSSLVRALFVLNAGILALAGCSKSDDAIITNSPSQGALAFASVTTTGMTVNWPEATSTVSTAAQIHYKLVYSTSQITELAQAEAATVAMDYTAATLTTNVTGLTDSTTYYFAVLAKDSLGNVGYATSSQATLCSGKAMYIVTNAGKGGSLGGVSGADTICTTNKPSGVSGTVKALLVDTTTRRACWVSGTANDSCSPSTTTGRAGWVFAASAKYCTSDYKSLIGSTNASAYLVNHTAGVLATTNTDFFTGMNIYWGTSDGNNCTNWTSTSGSPVTGGASKSGESWVAGGTSNINCNTTGNIVCVEQ